MDLAVIGCGYVGLVTGACFSDAGHNVTCVDVDEDKIRRLRENDIPIYEPGLGDILRRNILGNRIDYTTDIASAVAKSDVVFIAVGTPSRRGDGDADLCYVFDATRQLASSLSGYTVVVTKSTVPVGTGDEVERVLRELRPDAEFDVVSNPEFLREGSAITDFVAPDRIVIGTSSERAQAVMGELYSSLSAAVLPVFFTDRRSSELIKYTANAFLAMKITFINEIADLCEKIGANVQDIAHGIGMDKRIGFQFLRAGPGYGGSCFPKDTLALIKCAQDLESPLRLIETTVASNSQRKRAMGRKVLAACGGVLRGRKVAVLGLTFKADTDDMREAPSIDIIRSLQDYGAVISAYDPVVGSPHPELENLEYASGSYEACVDADAVVVLTEASEFRNLDLDKISSVMRGNVLVDLRNIFTKEDAARADLTFVAVGHMPTSHLDPLIIDPMVSPEDRTVLYAKSAAPLPESRDAAE